MYLQRIYSHFEVYGSRVKDGDTWQDNTGHERSQKFILLAFMVNFSSEK